MEDIHLNHVWNYTDVDRAFWREHLESFVPKRIIDAHYHVVDSAHWLNKPTPEMLRQYWVNEVNQPIDIQAAQKCAEVVYPGRQVSQVVMGAASLDFDTDAGNTYLAAEAPKRNWHWLAVIAPQWSVAKLQALLDLPGAIGVKPYYAMISSNPLTRDEHLEKGIFDFLPHHQLELLNARGSWVTLHVPKAGRLGHPENISQIKEIRRRYPKIILVIAHLGRSYTLGHAEQGLFPLADDEGLYFDNSAVLNPDVHRLAMKALGPSRIIYGTDNPIFYMRGRRQWRGTTYINRTSYPFHFNKDREPPEVEAKYTLYMYEALKAIKDAANDLGLSVSQVQDIFCNNAQRLIDKVIAQKG